MPNQSWNAQSYSENSQLQYHASKIFFDTLILKGDELILDIGCGTGLLTSDIARKIPQGKIIGIDSSEDMISYAKNHFQLPNLEFKLMLAEELNFSFKFDVIISSFCIHWIKDKQSLLNSLVTHLKPNGKIKIIMPFRHEEIANIRCFLMNHEKWSQYFDAETIRELLIFDNCYDTYAKTAGLDNLSFTTEEVTTQFKNKTQLKNFLKNITSSLHRLPTEELQEQFMQELVTLYLKDKQISSNGTCSITYTYGKISSQGIKK